MHIHVDTYIQNFYLYTNFIFICLSTRMFKRIYMHISVFCISYPCKIQWADGKYTVAVGL